MTQDPRQHPIWKSAGHLQGSGWLFEQVGTLQRSLPWAQDALRADLVIVDYVVNDAGSWDWGVYHGEEYFYQ